VYDAMLTHAGARPAVNEIGFARTWLGGCPPIPPDLPVSAAVTRLVEAFHAAQ
jgi:hypothetical protein